MENSNLKSSLWTRIKQKLNENQITNKEIELIESNINMKKSDLIVNNQIINREYSTWVEIYQEYISKYPLFKDFILKKDYTNEILSLLETISNIRSNLISQRIKTDDELFYKVLIKAVERHNSYEQDYLTILNSLGNPFFIGFFKSPIRQKDFPIYKLLVKDNHTDDRLKNIDLLIISNDVRLFDEIAFLLSKDNEYMDKVINEIKDNLDLLSDFIENDSLLSISKVRSLKKYLELHTNYISSLINN